MRSASALASRFGTIDASRPSVSTSTRPSASVATMGLPAASASNTVNGVPSHSEGKTLRSNADGLVDVLTDGRDASIVPKRDARALADRIIYLMDHPDERGRLAVAARLTGRDYDIGAFVRKMERLYGILHQVSRATRRRGVLEADLSFLARGALA
jgi:glycosyltransferase involved in cell wall biosynthesis